MKKIVNGITREVPPLKYRLRLTPHGLQARDVDLFGDMSECRGGARRRRWIEPIACMGLSVLAFGLAYLVGFENGQIYLSASGICAFCAGICWP